MHVFHSFSQGAYRRAALFAALVVAPASWSPTALAQASWAPDKPVEIVVPAAAGGGTDRTARLIQKILTDQKAIPTPTIVVNKPGAGSSIGNRYVAQHKGDGHYLAITQPTLITDAIMGLTTIGYTSFTPLAQLGTEYNGFAVKADSPLKSAKDIIDRLKQDPGSVSFAISNALGSTGHIALALVMKQAGIDPAKLTIVVFQSGGQSRTALLGGHVDVNVTTLANLVDLVDSGMVRTLAVTAAKRLPAPFANVPTWREMGVNAVIGHWRGVVGPPEMTPEQTAFWDKRLAAVAASDEWKADAQKTSVEVDYMDSASSRKFLVDQYREMERLLAQLGLAKTN